MNSAVKNIIFWVVMAVTALLIWAVVKSSTGERVTEVTFTAFMNDINKDNVKDVTIVGTEVTGVLKKDQETKQIPIILLTTRGEEHYVQEGYASGCSDYLTKPVNDADLLDLLKAYLGE